MDRATDGTVQARIPVFSSIPTKLMPDDQEVSRAYIYGELEALMLEPRTLGRSDIGRFSPLQEVRSMAKHCSGGIILGYHQVKAKTVTKWAKDGKHETVREYRAPTPWNHLETGILYGLGLPLLVLKEEGIDGGIFDVGASNVFVHEMPMPEKPIRKGAKPEFDQDGLRRFRAVLLRWQSQVHSHYYGDNGGC